MPVRHKGAALAILALAQLMIVLDASIVNVALKDIQDDLGFSTADLPWVVNAYTLVFGGFLLLGGRFADKLGRKRIFMAGLASFVVASGLGGASNSSGMLIASRALQGLGGALMAPAALSLVTVIFAEGEERNKALGIWGAIAAGGAAIGVLLGGILTEYLNWRWVFFVNIPIALIAIAGAIKLIPDSREEGIHGFDVAGAVTVTGGLCALVYTLVRGNEVGWLSGQTFLTAAISVVLLAAFVQIQRTSQHPLMPLRIFKRRSVIGADVSILLLGAGIFGMFFYVSLYMQRILLYSEIKTGLAFLPVSIVIGASAGATSNLLTKVGPRRLASIGLTISAVGLFLLGRIHPGGSYLSTVFLPLVVMSVGLGTSFVSLTSAGVAGVPQEDSGIASAMLNTGQQLGGAIGLALLTAVSVARTNQVGVPTNPADITSGWAWGFAVGGVLLLIGAVVAATTIKVSGEEAKAAMAHATA